MADAPFEFVVGTPLQVELPVLDLDCACNSRLIGYLEDSSLIIGWPEIDGNHLPLDPAEPVIVSFERDGKRHTFESRVLTSSLEPYAHVHLAWPERVHASLRRRVPRVPVNDVAMMLVMEEDGQKQSVALADISISGARLVATSPLGEVGERFSIEIPQRHHGGSERVVLACEMRYVREERGAASGRRVFHHGVEFIGLNRKALAFIERYIGQHTDPLPPECETG
ncbi:MAG TPA: flagellar brake protein [Thiotrichales bacterium]|nr:flagellar brake protein [Thiotrichales bacterium]